MTPNLKIRPMTPTTPEPSLEGGAPPVAEQPDGMRSLQQIMEALSELDRLRELERRMVFYVTHMTEGTQSISSFDNQESAAEYLRSIMGKAGKVGIFRGERWNLSKGPLKYLISPDPKDQPVPLFGTSCGIEIDVEGELGSEDDNGPRDKITIDVSKPLAAPLIPDRAANKTEEPEPTIPTPPAT